MSKNRIRLTESQLHNIVKKTIAKILNESQTVTVGEYNIKFDDDNKTIISVNGWGVRDQQAAIKTMGEDVYQQALQHLNGGYMNEAYYERKPNGQTIVHRDKQYFGGIPQQQQQTQQQQPNPKQILSQPPKCNNGYTIRDLHNTLGEERCQTLGGVAQYFKSCAKYGSVGNNSQFFRIFVNNENLNNALAAGAITQQERNIIVRIYNQDVAPYASANQQRSIEDLAKEVKRGYRVNLSSSEANRLINSGLVSPRDVAWAMGWRPEQGEEALKNYMPSF